MPSRPPRGGGLASSALRRCSRGNNPACVDQAREPRTYTRSTIHRIASLLRTHPWSTAQSVLRSLPVHWDSFTVNRVLKIHPPMQKAYLFFHWVASSSQTRNPSFRHDRFTYTTMLDILGEAGRVGPMRALLADMRARGVEPDAATRTSVMHWLARHGELDAAMETWREMRSLRGRCRPTVVSYTAYMKILFEHGKDAEAARVFEEMLELGMQPNCCTYTVLIEHLADSGKFEAALEIMNKMQEAGIEPDKALCNTFVQKCSKAGQTSVMTHVLEYMKEHYIVLRRPIFLQALEAQKANGESDCLLRELNPHLAFEGIDCDSTYADPSSVTDRSIILYFLTKKNWVAIEEMVSGMALKDMEMESHILSEIIEASCADYRPSCGLMVLRYSLRVRKELNRSAYSCLLGLYIRNESFDVVLEIAEGLTKAGCSIGSYLASALIYRLGCARLSAYAAQIFRSLLPEDHNVATYTALLDAYFQAGQVDKAIELFSEMKSNGTSVCFGTYDVLISGLQKAGRTRESEFHRREKMKLQSHGHYREGPSPEESLCNHLFSGYHG